MYDLDEWLKNAQSLHRLFYGKSNIDLNYEMEFTKNVAVRKKDFFSNKEQCGNSDEEPKGAKKELKEREQY